jgi:asparagine synthase (glutamine-hydrolysing)
MCGIAGFIDFNKLSNEAILASMGNAMRHRGPDGFGVKLFQEDSYQLGLAHQRLSIIDISSGGEQPMKFENFWICYNGEIYNFKAIKQELIDLGHTFVSSSDTEVILHAFCQWGIKSIHRFTGMFAFVIYDQIKQEVSCIRDRAGVKPFFYYFNEGLFLFSSELKAIHEHPAFVKSLDYNSIALFMQYGNIPAPFTIFEHTHKLKPGNFLQLDLKKGFEGIEKMIPQTYWNVYDFYNLPKSKLSYQEAKEKTNTFLDEACALRMVADVPVGVFLSGGYDSTAVVSSIQKNSTTKIKTFTIAVPDIGLNEADDAKKIAEYLGTDHTEIICDVQEAVKKVESLPYFFDEPFADSSAIPTMLVSEAAKKEVTVALSADGGDEIFAGYNRYDYLMKYQKLIHNCPQFLRNGLAFAMNQINAEQLPYFRNKYNFHQRYDKLKLLIKDPSGGNFMQALSKQFTASDLKYLFSKDFDERLTAYDSTELLNALENPLSFMMAIDYQTYLPDDILQKVDRSTMSASLEGREPLLDHHLMEFAAQLPDAFKYNKGIKKRILKDIVHDYVPKELMDRPKKGFAIPIGNWLNDELADLIQQYLAHDRITKQQIFNPIAVEHLVSSFRAGRKENTLKIWYLLMFQMWHQRWME